MARPHRQHRVYDGAQLLGTVAVSQGASLCGFFPCTVWQAAFSTASLAIGSHAITAVYSGDALYGPSTSTVVTANVLARPPPPSTVTTTTTLWSRAGGGQQVPPPSSIEFYQGDTLYLQGVLQYATPPGATWPDPTGSVAFYDGAQLLGSVTISQGASLCGYFPCTVWQAAFSTASLAIGSHAITAVYSGDALYGPSTSTVVTANVLARPPPPSTVATTTTLWSRAGGGQQVPPPSSIEFYQGDTLYLQGVLQYTTPPGATWPDPTGSVAFYDGAQLLGTVTISQGASLCGYFPCTVWQAAFSAASLAIGSHAITAVYSGDALYGPSTSTVVTANVLARPAVPVSFTGLTATNTGAATLAVSGGGPTCGFVRGEYLATSGSAGSPPVPPPPGLAFPHGLVAFVVGGCAPGSTINFELHLPTPVPPGTAYWKFGPTPADRTPHWYSIPVTVEGSKVRFSIVDGQLGDDDLTSNGTVIDAGGPAVLLAATPDAIPTLSNWLMATMALLMALLGAFPSQRGFRTRGKKSVVSRR